MLFRELIFSISTRQSNQKKEDRRRKVLQFKKIYIQETQLINLFWITSPRFIYFSYLHMHRGLSPGERRKRVRRFVAERKPLKNIRGTWNVIEVIFHDAVLKLKKFQSSLTDVRGEKPDFSSLFFTYHQPEFDFYNWFNLNKRLTTEMKYFYLFFERNLQLTNCLQKANFIFKNKIQRNLYEFIEPWYGMFYIWKQTKQT